MDCGCHTMTQIWHWWKLLLFLLCDLTNEIKYDFICTVIVPLHLGTIIYIKSGLWVKSIFWWKRHGVTFIKIAYILAICPWKLKKICFMSIFIVPLHLGTIWHMKLRYLWVKFMFSWKRHGVTLNQKFSRPINMVHAFNYNLFFS